MEDRKAYINKTAAQLKEWDAEIDKLKAKAEQAKAEVKIEYQEELKTLREKKKVAETKLNQLAQASDKAWDELKSGATRSFQEMKSALDSAMFKFKQIQNSA